MPAPTNISFVTATELGTLPASVSVQVDNAGTTYTVYYKFTPSADGIIGAFGFGDLSVYKPTTTAYVGPAGAPTSLGIAAQNRPIQFPVTGGTEYFLKVQTNGGNPSPANLTLAVEMFVQQEAPVGSIVIPDDADGFPAAIVDPATGDVIRFLYPFPAGESGDVLDDGTILVEDNVTQNVTLFDADFVQQATAQPFGAGVSVHVIRLSPALQTFYVGTPNAGGTAKIATITADGSVGGTIWNLGSAGLTAIAPNNTGSIVYVSGRGGSTNTPIKQWLTGTSAFDASDLIAAQGANTQVVDMLVLDDDTIVAAWLNTSTSAIDVRHISAAGSVIATYSTTNTGSSTTPKLAYDSASRADHVWLWSHAAAGATTFHKIAIATMTATTVTGMEFEGGAYEGAATATPTDRFGFSFSCPFFLTRAADEASIEPPSVRGPSEECCPCEENPQPPAPGQSPTDSAAPLPSVTGAILPPTFTSVMAWVPSCAGGGDVPTAADATDAESWVS